MEHLQKKHYLYFHVSQKLKIQHFDFILTSQAKIKSKLENINQTKRKPISKQHK